MKKVFLPLIALFILTPLCASSEEPAQTEFTSLKSESALAFTPEEINWLNTKPTLTYVYDPDWPPFEWSNAIQEHIGITADVLAIISDKTGITFTPVRTNSWAESVKLAEADKVDMYSAVAVTDERSKYLNFTSQSIYSYIAIFISDINNRDFTYTDNHNFKGKKIAVIRGNLLSKTVEENNPEASYIYVDSAQEGFNMVRHKEADLFAINAATGIYFINHKGYTDTKVYTNIDFVFDLKIALQKRMPPEAISVIDKALLSIDKSQLSQIFNKWTTVRVHKDYDYSLVIGIIFASLIIIIIFLFLNKKLRSLLAHREISEQKLKKAKDDLEVRVEERTKELVKTLESMRKLSQTVEQSPSLMFITNTQGIIEYANTKFYEVTGFTPEDVIGKAASMFKSRHTSQSVYEELWTTIKAGDVWHGELEDQGKDGVSFWVDATITPIRSDEGEITHFSSSHIDITERKAVELKLFELSNSNIDLENKKNKLEVLSVTDHLTQLFNRAKLDEVMLNEVARAERYNYDFCVVLLDLDHFKDVNDKHGHLIGDEVLIAIAQILKKHTRSIDIVGRWGGEEFLIICPETNRDGVATLSEKLRENIESYDFPIVEHITASFGVAIYQPEDTVDNIVARADKALYKAKSNGRNCIEIL